MTTKTPPLPCKPSAQIALQDGLLEDLRHMIDQTRKSIASTANAGLTLLYWHVGSRIRKKFLLNERAEYGKKIVATVSRQLTKAVLAQNGYSSKKAISTKLIEIYERQAKQLEQEVEKLEQERHANTETDRLNCLLGTIPQDDNSDKI
ncbi:MAG: DUF1016 N-terminal domain-containing protein, partial [Chlamydiales bacterium]